MNEPQLTLLPWSIMNNNTLVFSFCLTGAVVASPDHNTPGGSYYYHWMRDGALTMRAFQILSPADAYYKRAMEAYTKWVIDRQAEAPVHDGVDVRVEPKFEIPSGEVFSGSWCRPQNDGPGLRAISLITFAKSGHTSKEYIKENLWPAIKYDLDWVVSGYDENSCDLWEEVQSNDFFWNRVTQKKALIMGAAFAASMGDSSTAESYKAAAGSIRSKLASHWTGTFVAEASNRQIDSSVFIGFNNGFDVSDHDYAPTSFEVASTVNTYVNAFCAEYPVNTGDTEKGIPGVLIGRYPGDTYANGNPWILTTAALAQLLYRAAAYTVENGPPKAEALRQFSSAFNVDFPSDAYGIAQTFAAAGNSVLMRIREHVKEDGGHLAEQLDRNNGAQMSAADLTWSYAEILLALHAQGQLK